MKREITVEIDFCYGHRLLGYSGKCSHYHGHNAKVQVCVSAFRLNELGFVIDFSVLKHDLKDWVNEHWDHHMILNVGDKGGKTLRDIDEWIVFINGNSTAEWMATQIALLVQNELLPKYEEDVQFEWVKFWETPTSYATVYGENIEAVNASQ